MIKKQNKNLKNKSNNGQSTTLKWALSLQEVSSRRCKRAKMTISKWMMISATNSKKVLNNNHLLRTMTTCSQMKGPELSPRQKPLSNANKSRVRSNAKRSSRSLVTNSPRSPKKSARFRNPAHGLSVTNMRDIGYRLST